MKGVLPKYGILIAFFVVYAICAIWQPGYFLSPEFFKLIFTQNVYIGLVAIGMTFVIMSGGIDLSVGSMMGFVGAGTLMTVNMLIGRGVPDATAALLALPIAAIYGSALGMLNGVLIAYVRVTPFIVTLVGLIAFRSLAQVLGDAGEIRSVGMNFQNLGNTGWTIQTGNSSILISWAVFLWVLTIPLASFLLNRTRFGRYVIAVGANERAARYSGINVASVKVKIYTLMGAFVGLAALTSASRMNSVATSNMGLYAELDAIAAVVIGGTALKGGSGRIWGTIVGVLLVGMIQQMLTTSGLSEYWKGAVRGGIILLAVVLQRSRAAE